MGLKKRKEKHFVTWKKYFSFFSHDFMPMILANLRLPQA
jgi:hypothetical protein